MADPPLCTWFDCERMTLKHLLDMHEALDLRAASADKATKERAR